MKYQVDIDSVINELLQNNIGIGSALECRYNIGRVYHYMELLHPIFQLYHHDIEWNENLNISGRATAYYLLNNPFLFNTPLYHLLFKSFVAAEGKFVKDYIPQNSHEERLTGHLVSELKNELFILREHFQEVSREIYGEVMPLNFYYADLSSNKQEKLTGADLGLIFYVNLPDIQLVRLAAIQVKKFNKNGARIDIPQLETLMGMYDSNAYYMFYDMDSMKLPPMIERAIGVKDKRGDKKDGEFYYCSKYIQGSSVPLSIFLIFDLLNNDTSSKKEIRSIWHVKEELTNANSEGLKPSRILVVSLGSFKRNDDIQELKELFRGDFQTSHIE